MSVFDKSVESTMANVSASKMQIEVANPETMPGRKDGTLHMFILDGKHASRDGAIFQHQNTTVEKNSRELFSVDDLYVKHRFNVLLRQPDFESGNSELYRAASGNTLDLRIPLRYDRENGGFGLDYMLADGNSSTQASTVASPSRPPRSLRCTSKAHKALLATFSEDQRALSIRAATGQPELNFDESATIIINAYANAAVTEVVMGQHEESAQTNIRGVKS